MHDIKGEYLFKQISYVTGGYGIFILMYTYTHILWHFPSNCRNCDEINSPFLCLFWSYAGP